MATHPLLTMPDVKVTIQTVAEGQGAQQTAQDLKKVTEQVKEAKAPAENLGKANEELTKKAGGLKEVFNELKRTVPEFGSLMLLLKNPVTILAGAVGVLVAAFRNYMMALRQMEEAQDVHRNVSRVMLAMSSASTTAAREVANFKTELAGLATEGNNANDSISKLNQSIQTASVRMAELDNADKALALANINEQERTGKLSPADAIRARGKVEERFEELKQQRALQQLADQQEARKDTLRKTAEQRARAEAALPGAETEAAEAARLAAAAKGKRDSDLAAIKTEREAVAERRASALESLDGWQMKLMEGLAAVAPAGSNAANAPAGFRAAMEGEVASTDARLAQLDKEEQFAETSFAKTSKRAADARSHADSLRATIKGGRDTEGRIFEEISAGEMDIEQTRFHQGRVGAVRGATREVQIIAALKAANEKLNMDLDETSKVMEEREEAVREFLRNTQRIHRQTIREARAREQ